MDEIAIAVDGPASSGKGTVARAVARALGYAYIDTGAMYRTVALMASQRGVAWDEPAALGALAAGLNIGFVWDGDVLRIQADGRDVSQAIRSEEVGGGASTVSRFPSVRQALLGLQRDMAARGGVVMDGRDIGTVVLPQAELKVYLDADLAVRARRRHEELVRRGETPSYQAVRDALAARDQQDMERDTAPLAIAEDAVVVDSTDLSVGEVVARVIGLATACGARPAAG